MDYDLKAGHECCWVSGSMINRVLLSLEWLGVLGKLTALGNQILKEGLSCSLSILTLLVVPVESKFHMKHATAAGGMFYIGSAKEIWCHCMVNI